MKRRFIILSLLFLLLSLFLIQSNVIGNRVDTYEYNPIFWDDWNSEEGAYTWNEENSTFRVEAYSTVGEDVSRVSRYFEIESNEDRIEVSYLYRYLNSTHSSKYSWWNTSFLYRKTHTITGTALGVQTDYQMCFEMRYGSGTDSGNKIYLNSHSQTDFDDIRFVKNDDTTLFDIWLDNYTASTVAYFWVEIDSIPVSPNTVDVYIYYGNDSVSSVSNGESTFLLFDDFEDNSLNTSLWSAVAGTGGSVQEIGNELAIQSPSGATSASYVTSLVTIPINVAITFTARDSYEANPCHIYRGLWIIGVPWVNVSWFMAGILRDGSLNQAKGMRGSSSGQYLFEAPADCYTNNSVLIRLTTADNCYYNDHTASATRDYTADSPSYPESFGFFAHYTTAQEIFYVLDVYVRNYAITEPTHTSTSSESIYSDNDYTYSYVELEYMQTTTNLQNITVFHNSTHLWVNYYNWSSQESFQYYNFSSLGVSYDNYLIIEWDISTYYRRAMLEVSAVNETLILTDNFPIDTVPSKFTNMYIGAVANRGAFLNANASLEIVWIDAPFDVISGLRDWKGKNTGTEWYENPYWMRQSTTGDDEEFTVKVIPFQAYKTIVNWSMVATNGVQGGIRIKWYDRAGNALTGYVGIWWYRDAGVYFLDFIYKDSGAVTHIVTSQVVNREDAFCFTVWIDQSDGNAYAYIQDSPHSSEFVDYWIVEISDIVDFDSWGAEILHESVACGVVSASIQWQEVEIFYGAREGVMQPRFGGMWWLANPLVFWLMQIVFGIQAALAPIAQAIAIALSAPLTAIVTAIQTMYSWLQDISQIWGVIITLIVDVWDRFVSVIFPVIFGLLFTTFFAQLNAILGGMHVTIITLLTVLSTAMFGDATILPTMYINFITGMQSIFYTFGVVWIEFVTFVVILIQLVTGQPVVGFVISSSGINFIFMLFYYVATYLPLVIFMHMLLTLLKSVNDQSIEPLISMMLIYMTIAKLFYDVIVSIVNVILGVLQAIGGFIPFT